MAGVHQFVHLPIEEREQQRADVGAVDVGVGHDHDFVVAALGEIDFFADADADGGDHAADFLVGEDFVFARFVGVDDFAAEREDGLIFAEAATFGAAAGRIALDQVQLAAGHVAAGAVAELAGQAAAGQGAFALAQQGFGFAGGFAGFGSEDAFADDDFGDFGIFFEVFAETIADDGVDDAFDFAVAELGFGLAFELRMGDAHRDDGGEAFADIVAGGNEIFQQVFLLAVLVQRASECGAEAGNVGAAFDGVDVVDVGVDVFGVFAAILQGDFVADAVLLAADVDDVGMQRFAGAIEVLDEFDDAALVVEFVVLAVCSSLRKMCAPRLRKASSCRRL